MDTVSRAFKHPRWIWLLLGLAATSFAFLLTERGPGTAGDSTSYLMGAENLLLGDGFSRYSGAYEIRPITGFPPVYSLALALPASFGIELQDGARLLNALLFGANLILVCGLVHRLTGSVVAPTLAGFLFLTRPILIELHSWVMSEPLFIFLSLLSICALGLFLAQPNWRFLLLGGVLAALASLTRYVGVAVTASGVIAIALLGARPLRKRLRDVGTFAAVALLPLLGWLARNQALGGTTVNRALGYHPIDPDLLRLFMADMSSWLVPHQLPLPTAVRAVLAVAIAAGLLLVLATTLRRRWLRWDLTRYEAIGPEGSKPTAVPWLLGLFCAWSLILLWANSTLLDAATTAAAPPRYLAPVYVPALILFTTIATAAVKTTATGWRLRFCWTGYALMLIGFYAYNSLPFVQDPLSRLGYTGRKHAWAEMTEATDGFSKGVPIVSNNPELIYILLDRPAYARPIQFDPYRHQLREDYESQYTVLEQQLENGGVFVFFEELEADDFATIERMDLQLLAQYPMAQIFSHPRGPTLE